MTAAEGVDEDGRHLRRRRNRERVVDAYVELLREGVPDPSAGELARRADVTSRTVYRYLRDDSSLKLDVGYRIVSDFRIPEPAAGWNSYGLSERIDAFLTFGMQLYDQAAPIVRVARANFATGPVVDVAVQGVRQTVREQISNLFAPELGGLDEADRHAEVSAIHAFLLFDTLEYLHMQHDREGVVELLRSRFHMALSAASERGDARARTN